MPPAGLDRKGIRAMADRYAGRLKAAGHDDTLFGPGALVEFGALVMRQVRFEERQSRQVLAIELGNAEKRLAAKGTGA